MSSEAKVGMFFVVAVLLVGVVAVYLGDFWVRAASYSVTAYFRDVQGLPAGAEVRYAGVRIGKVAAVELAEHPDFIGHPAAVRMAIFRNTVLYATDEFLIQQGALLGDKYVEVRRATAKPKSKLTSHSTVVGGESASLVSLTDEARQLVTEARGALQAVQGVIATDFNRDAIRAILGNVVTATRKADSISAEALKLAVFFRKSAAETGPEVAAMARNLRETSDSVKSTAQLIRVSLASSPVPGEMAQASANVRQATDDLAAMSQNLAAVIGDPATRSKLEGMLANLHKSSQDLSRLTARANQLMSDQQIEADVRTTVTKLRESAESLASLTAHTEALITDPEFTADVQATVKSAREAAESGAEAAVKAGKSLDRVDSTMDRLGESTAALRPADVRARTTLEGSTSSGLRLDFDVDIQYGNRHNDFWRFGVRDIGDAERLNLQRALSAQPGARWRVGIFANKLGVGYDFWQDRRLGFETELWDPEELHFDVRGAYGVFPRGDLLFGLTDVGHGTDPFVGLRYRRAR